MKDMKQEILEEAAKKKYPMFKGETCIGNNKKMLRRAAFIKGAEWMQERMYSEEEVIEISLEFFYYWWSTTRTSTEEIFDEWFEQFKKK